MTSMAVRPLPDCVADIFFSLPKVREKVRAEDLANADLKSTLRVLYMVFTKYKHI